jgi:hypothetical protein
MRVRERSTKIKNKRRRNGDSLILLSTTSLFVKSLTKSNLIKNVLCKILFVLVKQQAKEIIFRANKIFSLTNNLLFLQIHNFLN